MLKQIKTLKEQLGDFEHLSREFEYVARETMSAFFGVPLSKRMVSNVQKVFDMVSLDCKIVGDAKYFKFFSGVSTPHTNFSVIAEYVWLLEKTSAEHKFLVFGNDRRILLKWLKKYGHLVKDVKFYFLDEQSKKLKKLN